METTDYGFIPLELDGVRELADLALNLNNCWDHGADEIWRRLDPELWTLTRNAWLLLQTVSRSRLRTLLADDGFRKLVAGQIAIRAARDKKQSWFDRAHPNSPLTCAAYFSMEFGLSEALPIYSGGLGNVAGDQLKAADDLGVPVAAVGLLYQQGYFRQQIDAAGEQTELYPFNDPAQLPIVPVRDSDGQWYRIVVALPGHKLWLRVWQALVGSRRLYLIDSNDPANPPVFRGVTSELYGGGSELRLRQELVLGIGGWRLLTRLGLRPEVCHLNEGHAAFVVLERARSLMDERKIDFRTALAITRAGNLFTTHTPVAAGFDRFAPDLMEQHLKLYAERVLHIGFDDLMALGRRNRHDSSEPFNVAYLAMRGSGTVNAVSRLHGEVSRAIFEPLFERWPNAEVPISYVTNGVHTPTWQSDAADRLWISICGNAPWSAETEEFADRVRKLSDAEIWKMRADNRAELVENVNRRFARQSSLASPLDEANASIERIFDPNAMTLGFARRFAEYKRPNLLLRDPERLVRILTSRDRPVQMVVAGKAHPADRGGKALVHQWVMFARRPDVRARVIFLSDYDLLLAENLVHGVDLWINTPRRPWEACGTSGMKVLPNGGLNLSELDGWWAEAYSPDIGWALGDGGFHGEDPAWDAREAEQLYELLEHAVIPKFYERDGAGIPRGWTAMVRESMARLTPQFSANRALREYTENHYLPAAARFRQRADNNGALGAELVRWESEIDRHWSALHFGNFSVETANGEHHFQAQVYLDDLDPNAVAVEIYADGLNGGPPTRLAMTRGSQLVGATHGWIFHGMAAADRPAGDFTARVIPHHPDAQVPLEAAQIIWQR